ncbi:hypothetical protein [Microbacterium capsulatum]|uniref:DUF559 domain-containing protein n=1 Tax=Microbacterium capsulatum TaxID=3041921 RepID=A0ABU0XLC8_9MICO|nr:hypothetical protein [Microbacterium sp. ASV81]MDQ4214535.1 hypothetical protein [Microbacterium sp. ASV81]
MNAAHPSDARCDDPLMDEFDAFGIPTHRCVSYQELRGSGVSREQIRDALALGLLRRARRDVYLSGDIPDVVFRAQRVGGRLDCVAALEARGVFVHRRGQLHVQVEPHRARLRSPHSRRKRLEADGATATIHWRSQSGDAHTVDVVSALVQSFDCQEPRQIVATLDSALFLGEVDSDDVAQIFSRVPHRYRSLRRLIDGRAESGPESLARLQLRQFGRRIELQKVIDGVGRVDILVDGWIVVECDSRAHHAGWQKQEEDRRRDLALAARGYACVRPTANIILTEPHVLTDAVRGLLACRR